MASTRIHIEDERKMRVAAAAIGRGSRGYVALYRYVAKIDIVFLLAVRSQRESQYKRKA